MNDSLPWGLGQTNVKWVAQVSLLRPGCSGQDPFARRNPGLKSETWATHLKFGGCSLISTLSANADEAQLH